MSLFFNPKLMHILHSAPCLSSSHLPSYNLLLKSTLINITNIDFQNNVYPGLQATLPVNHGGIGIRSVVNLIPFAFWLQLMDQPLLFIVSCHFGLVKFSTLQLVLSSHSGVMTKVSLLRSCPSPSAEVMGHPLYSC